MHAQYRKVAVSPYSFNNIERMEPLVDGNIARWLGRLDGEFAATGAAFGLAPWDVYLGFDVLSEMGIGASSGFIEKGADLSGLIMPRLYPFIN